MRLEAFYGAEAPARLLAAHAADVYGGATVTVGLGVTNEWGEEPAYIVTVFAPAVADRLTWESMARLALGGSEEEAVLVAFVPSVDAVVIYHDGRRERIS